MTLPDPMSLLATIGTSAHWVVRMVYDNTLTLGGSMSVYSLGTAFLIAAGFLAWKRRAKRPRVRLRALVRVLLPARILLSRSAKADYGMVLFSTLLFGLLFGWALISTTGVSRLTAGGLESLLGPVAPSTLPWLVTAVVFTVALYLAYEVGYWLDHWLAHTWPLLWEFHKVHHQAEVLTPLTTFRVHPVDTIVFFNILAVTIGVTEGALLYGFGTPVAEITISGKNAILIAFVFLLSHLQHSHVWIATTGLLGRIIMSPAHHQIHHSTNPIHFNKNFGSQLAVFDWLFGTLHVPKKEPEKLAFGVEPDGTDPHTVTGLLVAPLVRAAGHLGVSSAGAPQPQTDNAG